MKLTRPFPVSVALVASAALLAGCTSTVQISEIEKKGTEALIKENDLAKDAGKLDCPGKDLEVKKGKTIDCTFTFQDDTEIPAEVKLTNDSGNFTVKADASSLATEEEAPADAESTDEAAMESDAAMDETSGDLVQDEDGNYFDADGNPVDENGDPIE